MIVSQHNNMPCIDGVILIDMWVPRDDIGEVTNEWYRRVLRHLYAGWGPKYFVNACYMNRIDTTDRSIKNTSDLYKSNHSVQANQDTYCQGLNQTSEIIRELLENKNSIFLLDADDFVMHWRTHLYCLPCNWLVIGQTWQICLHTRPMGLQRLQLLSQQTPLKFYMTNWSGFTEQHTELSRDHFATDELPWAEIPGFGYQLLP